MPTSTPVDRWSRPHGPVTSELCVRLATLLNDFNPAHYDHDFAMEIGMPGVIAPGTLLQGWIATDVTERFGWSAAAPDRPRLRGIDLRFTSPVFLNEHILIDYDWQADRAALTITASPEPGADGRTVATGTVRVAAEETTRTGAHHG
ncbi:MAG TPA: MaoC family dehydratase [Acidimicrobiales bacterium]|nr:MaoC family dehydratase [Acidimicrobiales bacterium]